MMKRLLRMIIACGIVSGSLLGEVKLPSVFGDNMVLQQKTKVPIWGWAGPGEKVIVTDSWQDKVFSAKTSSHGKWMVKLSTPEAGGPYSITIKGHETIRIENVMIGEVWLCSGQSNMEMPLQGWRNEPILGSEEAIETAHFHHIRLFTVKRANAKNPQEDCEGAWQVCNPETIGSFSAVAYFFGRELFQKLRVPMGLIFSSWGGTPSEAWTSIETLREFEAFQEKLDHIDRLDEYLAEQEAEYQKEWNRWFAESTQLSDDHPGSKRQWMESAYREEGWDLMSLPTIWDETAVGRFQGVVWFARGISVPLKWVDRDLMLDLGPIDEMDETWFNGQRVGFHSNTRDWQKVRSYRVPASLVQAENNVITIRVYNLSGRGGIWGERKQMRLYPTGEFDNEISLAGKWYYKIESDINSLPPIPFRINPGKEDFPSVLYNAMIHPLVPYRIRGVIWYQGESNTYDPYLYRRSFPAMIKDWRKLWGQGNFPFYYVQIAPYDYDSRYDVPGLREAQLTTLTLPNTGMAVTMDIGTLNSIHPPNKEAVGKRLALWALAKTYDKKGLVFSGPIYNKMKKENDRIRIHFDFTGSGLDSRGQVLTHFIIAGKDRVFKEAEAIIDGSTVLVSSPEVSDPVAVRYGWSDVAQPNLFNKEGLPASPFRTDNWCSVRK